MAVLFNETTIKNYVAYQHPGMVAKADYSYSRNGNIQTYNVSVSIRCGHSSSWWNDPWTVNFWINNQLVAANWQIKGRTNYTLGTTWFTQTATFSINIGSSASGNIPFSMTIYANGVTQGSLANNYGAITPLPTLALHYQSKTDNSITLRYTYGNTAPSHIHVYNGGTFLGQFNSATFTISNLSPNTTYGDLKAYGYANGAYGPVSGSLSVKTYPSPVVVSNSSSVSGITPFSVTINAVSSDRNNTDLIEYSICNEFNSVLLGPEESTNYTYTFSNLIPETTYKARIRMRTKESNVWSTYIYITFVTLADQAAIYYKENDAWVKGEVFIKENDIWIEALEVYIKENDEWKVNTNS